MNPSGKESKGVGNSSLVSLPDSVMRRPSESKTSMRKSSLYTSRRSAAVVMV
jgi:hypothetical protein